MAAQMAKSSKKTLPGSVLAHVLAPAALALGFAAPLPAQDPNILLPTDSIEALFRTHDFQLMDWAGTRKKNDRTQRVILRFEDSTMLMAKWATSPRGGYGEFNNRPRYEIAAYELQKLFLDEPEYVVPPTVARCVTVDFYRQMFPWAGATFGKSESVLVVLQYWLWNVTAQEVWDKARFEQDSAYARHFANLNVFTYLIRHNDSNQGNVLISEITANPRVFAVDNGVAFDRREESNRGTKWRRLAVKRLPRETVERLRSLTRDELEARLSVVAQFILVGDRLVPTAPTQPLDRNDGVRVEDGVVQLGLTKREIGQVWDRIRKVIEKVDDGKIVLF